MPSHKLTASILAGVLLLFAPALVNADCPSSAPWEIALTGKADYQCFVTGPSGKWPTECAKGTSVCVTGNDAPNLPGGAVHLYATGADSGVAGTLIECTFNNPGGNQGGAAASNCDISDVDGYNFDVYCTGDVDFGYDVGTGNGQLENPWDGQCEALDTANKVCKNPNGSDIGSVAEAPTFFQGMGKMLGVYVAANQVLTRPPWPATATGGKITCSVNGGMPSNYGGSTSTKVLQNDPIEPVVQPVESVFEKREVHRHAGRHGHRRRVHARSLLDVVAQS